MQDRDELEPNVSFFTTSTGDAAIDADLQYIQSLKWAQSSIGPISSWPSELLILINLAMLSPQPQLFLLGPDSIILYNTAYGRLLCDHHPEYQGRPIALDVALIANAKNIDRIVDRASTRTTPANENWVPFFFLNHGVLQEVFLSATMVKLPLSIGGFHATTYDTTAEAVRARRGDAYDRIFTESLSATTFDELWRSLLDNITLSDDEIPFAILYSAHTEVATDMQTNLVHRNVSSEVFNLEGTVGIFDPLPPKKLELRASEGWITVLEEVARSHVPKLLKAKDNTLPVEFSRSSRGRCHGDDCQTAIVLPSTLNSNTNVHALLVLGLAPRRPYDEGYQSWIRTCNRSFENLIASIAIAEAREFAIENESRRATKERNMLAKELSLKNQEAALATGKVQRMLTIMESAGVGIFECLPTGEVMQANDSFCELSSCSKDLATCNNTNLFEYCDSRDSQTLSSRWNELLSGQAVTFTIRFRGCTATSQWVQANCVPVLNDALVVTSITGCITDVSAQKEIEQEAIKRAEALEKLRLSEARLLKFIETAPLGIMILDPDRQPLFANKTWFRLTQHEDVPVDKINIHSVIMPEDADLFEEKLGGVLVTGRSVDFQMRLRRSWETPLSRAPENAWVQLTAFPDIVDGNVQQIMVGMTDINHFKFAELIQRARLEEVIEAKRQQENFVDMTSHEIRNPLGAVIHCTDAICQTLSEMKVLIQKVGATTSTSEDYSTNMDRLLELHKDISDSVDTIMSCNNHQKRIVDDILSLSKLDSNLLEICPSIFDLTTYLQQVKSTFASEAANVGVTLRTEYDPSINRLGIQWIKADPGRVMQVLVNLVANAIKFTKGASSNREVIVSMGLSDTLPIDLFSKLIMAKSLEAKNVSKTTGSDGAVYLWFCVRDTGCGMDGEGRTRIFSRFSQASPKTYNKYGGSGLGLFISQKLTSLQDGEIGFTSASGQGSTFAFYVRAYKATRPKANNVVKSLNNGANDLHASKQQSGSTRLTVLLVEDNLINQKVLKKQLMRHGFKVHTADNGQDAFDFLQTTVHWTQPVKPGDSNINIDVILMDVEMPIIDGLQCAEMIRAAQRDGRIKKHMPIIAVTANARSEQLKRALEIGMDEAISKPFRIADLESVIARLGL